MSEPSIYERLVEAPLPAYERRLVILAPGEVKVGCS